MGRLFQLLFAMFVSLLTACGGGGGSPGSVGGSGSTSALTVSLTLLASDGSVVSDRSVPSGSTRTLRTSVTDSKGAAVNNATVKLSVTQDADYIALSTPSTRLTTNGVSDFPVNMSAAGKNGVATIKAEVTTDSGLSATSTISLQTTGGTGSAVSSSELKLGLALVDAQGLEIASRSISQITAQSLKVSVFNEANSVIPFSFTTVAFSKGSNLVKVVGSSNDKLTDGNGQALFALAPASVNAAGAVEATVTAQAGPLSATATFTMNVTAGVVTMGTLSISPNQVMKGQAVNISVPVLIDGVTATSNLVSVAFTSNCGTASPSDALVDGTGSASAVIQTASSGSCSVTASAGGKLVTGSYKVTAPSANSLQFISAIPEVIYQKNSTGTTLSTVKFRLIDTLNAPIQGEVISATLSNKDGGVNFCGTVEPQELTTDSNGEVSYQLCSGTLPTTLVVQAALKSNPTIKTTSNKLSVQTGLPTQRFFDLSASLLSINAGAGQTIENTHTVGTNYLSGKSTSVNAFLADRLGNPVPDGTKVVFVTEGGQFVNGGNQSSCILTAGRCSVPLVGQEYRPWGSGQSGADPRPGRVTLLAYADGEESFIDTNRNNRYDLGEEFEELGRPFIDADENGIHEPSYSRLIAGGIAEEQSFPLPDGVEGTKPCLINNAAVDFGLSVTNTCNGVWDGFTKVRRKIVVVFSGDEIGVPTKPMAADCVNGSVDKQFNSQIPCSKRTGVTDMRTTSTTTTSGTTKTTFTQTTYIEARVSDYNGNPLPADATLSYSETTGIEECKLSPAVSGNYGNTTEPIVMATGLSGCGGGRLAFKVTVENKTTSFLVDIPSDKIEQTSN